MKTSKTSTVTDVAVVVIKEYSISDEDCLNSRVYQMNPFLSRSGSGVQDNLIAVLVISVAIRSIGAADGAINVK